MTKGFVCLCALLAVAHVGASPSPSSIRVVNLGEKAIDAFKVTGFGFRDVGINRRPGHVLTPAFGGSAATYELYWRLEDGSVHGETVDLAAHLPQDAVGGSVVIGIHDDYLSVTWSQVHHAWINYRRIGNPQIYPQPAVPYYIGCNGPLLDNPLTMEAWKSRAREVLARDASALPEENRCALDWYIVPSNGVWQEPDEQTTRKLRDIWRAQIEQYKKEHGRD